jgi:hypothetical protein
MENRAMKDWRSVEGWFHEQDTPVNEMIAERVPETGICVTLGVGPGRSMAHLAECLQRCGKPQVTLVGVDHFFGHSMELAAQALKGWEPLLLVRQEVARAASLFADGTVSALFVDANHTYEGTMANLNAWLPKLRKDGVVCGHDYIDPFPGVKKAVDERFPTVEIVGTCWIGKAE